jgi:molybdopterin-binding protein
MKPGEAMKISARNKLPGRVEQITRGAATANVSVSVSGMSMTAAITVDAVEELGIKVGSEVIVIVKASDVMLAVAE